MTIDRLREKVREWDLAHTGDPIAGSKYSLILDQLDYHSGKEWRVFLPADHPHCSSSYMERLAVWVGNVSSEDDQKLLLEYALYISFFSHDDFAALYRSALNREIVRWIVDQLGVNLQTVGVAQFQKLISQEIHDHTWYCPVTDSMDINEFHKVNHLQGVGHRPNFASLQMLAENPIAPNAQLASDWVRYMKNPSNQPSIPAFRKPPLRRLVLLEDIVGSGTQCIASIRWAVNNLGVPVLFVPLILCPNGIDALRAEESHSNGLLKVRPVVELRRSDLLGPERRAEQGWPISTELEDLAVRLSSRASPQMDTFGYRGTGCSIVTFANAPDNTLPLVHNKPANGSWNPLFPRVYRD